MEVLINFLKIIGLIAVVIMTFNITIFVHELGHFLAARWRGLHVDRFQVWFGKPVWKKEINGVMYGLGSIPAGGFVSLPQMAPMQAVEGEVRTKEALPPISPLDKIIVAAAGPLFSVLLALVFALAVWGIGKPMDRLETRTIGFVEKGSPAEQAGLLPGDEILKIDDQPVEVWAGDFEMGISENIKFSEHETIAFTLKRDGDEIVVNSGYKLPDSKWWQRRGLRQVGILWASRSDVDSMVEGSPAEEAGFRVGDEIVSVNGEKILSPVRVSKIIEELGEAELTVGVIRSGQELSLKVTPRKPKQPHDRGPMLGIGWGPETQFNETLIYPNPVKQVRDSVVMMWITITKVLAPGSAVGVQHLSGPVGIAKAKYDMLLQENGWRKVIWFTVFFNINLAILNLLPFPVLDGGHIVMATLEKLKGEPMSGKLLEVVQTGFALVLISFMLFVTSKDIPDLFTGGSKKQPVETKF